MDTERVGDGKQHRRKQSQRLRWPCCLALVPDRHPSQLSSCTLCLLAAATQWESWAHFSKWHTEASTGTHPGKAKAEGLGCTVKNTPQLSICEPSHFGPSFVHSPHLLVDHDHRAGAAAGRGQAGPSRASSVSPTFCPPPLPVTQSVPRALTLSLSCRKRSRTWMVRRGHHRKGLRLRTVSGTSVLMRGPDSVGGGLCPAGDPRSWGSSAEGRDGVGQWPEWGMRGGVWRHGCPALACL